MAKEDSAVPVENTIQLAEILSDLTSLRVCDPAAALALVSARPAKQERRASITTAQPTARGQDPDLQRAKDLVELHYSVKEAHKRGELGKGLEDARMAVWSAVGS